VRLRANPAIRTAEVTDLPPLSGGDQDITAIPLGSTPVAGQPPSIWYRSVSVGYLNAMGMKIIAGRGFTAEDRNGAPRVGIVNQQAANRFWPGENPIGRVLASGPEPDAPKITIVGIVASAHHDGPTQPYKAELFVPIEQSPARAVAIMLEPAGDVASLTSALRQTVREIDPLIPVSSVDPIEGLVGDAVALPRLYSRLVTLFAGAALLLAALGVYGVMAYAVVQRQREIGVRLALGAEPARIGRMVLGEGGRLALIGLPIGLGGSALLGRLLGKLLFGVTPYDPLTLAVVPPVLAGIMILASWIPARRAMRMDPLVAIRDE
jgi:predicted permease